MDGASRRCTRRCTAASSRGATCRSTWRRSKRTASRRSTCSSSTSIRFAATVAKRRLHARGRDREHRHRRAGDGALGGEELAATSPSSSTLADYAGVLAELDGARQLRRRDALRARAKAFAHTARTTARSATTFRSRTPPAAQRRVPGSRFRSSVESCRTCATARTRTSAPRSIATLRPRPAIATAGSCRARSSRTTTSPTPTRRGNA